MDSSNQIVGRSCRNIDGVQPGAINNEIKHTLIDDIDKNGYLVRDEEEIEVQLGEVNDDPHVLDNDVYLLHEENETQSTNDFHESVVGCSVNGTTFNDADFAYNFYNEYALSKGFGIRKHYTNRHSATKEIYRHVFVCNKQGYKDTKQTTDDMKRRCIKRTGCKATMQVTLSNQGNWVVDKFEDDHNHPFDDPSQVPRQWSHKVFHRSKECRDLVTQLSKAGIRPCEIARIVNAYKGNQHDELTRVQCSSIVTGERKNNLGKECHGIIMHFQEKAELDKDFYFSIDLSIDGTFRNVFWADSRSRSSYNQFGDVVVFDVTYKTNKFSFPFAPFVGVNHHGQSILLGAALLENETETTFTWLFKHFLKCMNGCPPISIITDQDLAMGKAISKVFPKTKHRFCAWHIRKHVLEHLKPLRFRYDDFQDTYTKWVKSQNINDFEAGWEDLKEKYNIDDNSWLGNMYKLRHHWVKAYLKDTFFAGMTTSGRSESIHSYFDGFVNSKTMLNDFVVQYDKAVSLRRSAEEEQNFRTLNSQPTLQSDHPIEVMAAKCYTRNIYETFKKEWKASVDCGHEKLSKDGDLVKYRVGYLKGNKESWKTVEYKVASNFFATSSCAKFETSGILCKHILYIMKRKLLTSIPDHYILPRWTMKATYKVGSIGTRSKGVNDVNKEVDFLTLWSIRTKFNKVLEEARDSLFEIEKLNKSFDNFLEAQYRRKNMRVHVNSEINSNTPIVTQRNMSQHIHVSDPINPVKTKGRPKVATRIKSGMEIAMNSKKRKMCAHCKGIGHNITGCQKRKMENQHNNNLVEGPLDFTNT